MVKLENLRGTFHNNEPDTGDALQIFADWSVGRGRVDRGLIVYSETQLSDGQFMVGDYGLYTLYADETKQKILVGPAYMDAEQAEIYKKRKAEDDQRAEYEKQHLQENKVQDEDKKLQENKEKENQKIFSSNLLIVAQEAERVKKALTVLSNAGFYSSVDFIRELGQLSDTLSTTSKESMSRVDFDKLSQFIRKTKNRSYHEAFEMNVPGVDNLYYALDELERYFSHVKK